MRKMRNSAGIASNFDEQRNLRASKNSLELETLFATLPEEFKSQQLNNAQKYQPFS